jgi:hypothetical protein
MLWSARIFQLPINALTVHVEYWAGICPVFRLIAQVEFVGENADVPQEEILRRIRATNSG